MSYEGYEQLLCKNGHPCGIDCYATRPDKCEVCGADIVWYYPVDVTNGSDPETGDGMPYKFEIDVPAKTCTCPTCGITHVVEPARYKIPTNAGNRLKEGSRSQWISLGPEDRELEES